MTSGIQSIVDTYVRLGRIDALTSLRAHRRKLLAVASDRSHFNFAVARELPPGAHQSIKSLEVRAPYETIIVYSRTAGRASVG
jgi:hypothetical protein